MILQDVNNCEDQAAVLNASSFPENDSASLVQKPDDFSTNESSPIPSSLQNSSLKEGPEPPLNLHPGAILDNKFVLMENGVPFEIRYFSLSWIHLFLISTIAMAAPLWMRRLPILDGYNDQLQMVLNGLPLDEYYSATTLNYVLTGTYFIADATGSYFCGVIYQKHGPKNIIISALIITIIVSIISIFVDLNKVIAWTILIVSLCLGILSGIMKVTTTSVMLSLPVATEVGRYVLIYVVCARIPSVLAAAVDIAIFWDYYNPDYFDGDQILGQMFPIYRSTQTILQLATASFNLAAGGACIVSYAFSNFSQIYRSDGVTVEFNRWTGINDDLKEFAYIGLDTFVCKLFIVFVFTGINYMYFEYFFIPMFFNMRSQGSAKLIAECSHITATIVAGLMLDSGYHMRYKMRWVWMFIVACVTLGYTFTILSQFKTCNGLVDRLLDYTYNRGEGFAYFPIQKHGDGCDFLKRYETKKVAQCVQNSYYGWCNIELTPQPFQSRVCSRDLNYIDVCIDTIVNYRTEMVFPIISLIFVPAGEGALNVMILWMIAWIAGPRENNLPRYIAVYSAFKAIGGGVPWFFFVIPDMLHRYQLMASTVVAAISMVALYSSISTVEVTEFRRQMYEKKRNENVSYEYYYSYYESGEGDDDENKKQKEEM